MTLLCDWQIAALARDGMIDPFVDHQVRDGVISYGLSSAGYDMRLAPGIRFPVTGILDPKDMSRSGWVTSDAVRVEPHSFVLARSIERFKLPRDIAGVVWCKSTYARCGVTLNVTPLEPGWEGYLTIEIINDTPLATIIYPNEGIGQIQFHRIEYPDVSYADRKGKYQNQPAEPIQSKI